MKRKYFYSTMNPDSDGMFVATLLKSGYEQTRHMAEANFIFHDAVHPNVRKFLETNPGFPNFITPHTPQSWFLWDGINVLQPTLCNFVAGMAGVEGMKAYGYPYRVEAVGFNRCKVREFTPTYGNDLLIIPAHANKQGKYVTPNYMQIATRILEKVIDWRGKFGKITLLWCETRIDIRLKRKMMKAGFRFVYIDPFTDPAPLQHVIEEIEKHDLVIGCGTAGCVSVAIGKPTVFFSEVGPPRSLPRAAKNYHLYLHDLRFPLMAESMSLNDILAVRYMPNEKVERWKQRNIGGDFDAEKVIAIVREYI